VGGSRDIGPGASFFTKVNNNQRQPATAYVSQQQLMSASNSLCQPATAYVSQQQLMSASNSLCQPTRTNNI